MSFTDVVFIIIGVVLLYNIIMFFKRRKKVIHIYGVRIITKTQKHLIIIQLDYEIENKEQLKKLIEERELGLGEIIELDYVKTK